MKWLISLIFILWAFPAFGAGSCVPTSEYQYSDNRFVQYTCTADASSNFIVHNLDGLKGWSVIAIETNPGATAPTDASDITLIDSVTGVDILGADGTDFIDATSSLLRQPYDSNLGEAYIPMVKEFIKVTVTNNSVNSAVFYLTFTLRR